MRRAFQITLSAWFAITMTMAPVGLAYSQSSGPAGYSAPSAAPIDTRGYTANQDKSRALTEYLKQHRLPLVGAQVLDGPGGSRVVVLYGFVATDFGKADARTKAQSYLGDSSMAVDNRIMVNPELQMAGRSTSAPAAAASDGATPNASAANASAPADAANSESRSSAEAREQASNAMPGIQSYIDQQNQGAAAAQGQQGQFPMQGQFPLAQGSIGGVSSMLPLVALLGILGMGMINGGNSSSGFGAGGPSPYGASPFGASPYGNSPYGNSPYGNPPYGSSPSYGPGAPSPYNAYP